MSLGLVVVGRTVELNLRHMALDVRVTIRENGICQETGQSVGWRAARQRVACSAAVCCPPATPPAIS